MPSDKYLEMEAYSERLSEDIFFGGKKYDVTLYNDVTATRIAS